MDAVHILVGGLAVMALITAISLVWAFYLDHKIRVVPVPKNFDVHVEGTKVFSDTDLSHVEHIAEEQLQAVVKTAAERFEQSLNASIDQVAARVGHMAESTVSQEFEKYQITLQTLQTQSVQEFGKLQQELNAKHAELLENLEAEVAAEREKSMDDFNARLSDVVSSYLAEALGSNVDLGAQSAYIISMLEQHKDDMKRDVVS